MAVLLLLVLALRALLAPGIMPDFAANTGSLITICTPQGERPLLPDDGQGGHAEHADAPCLFAATGFANLGAVTGPVLSTLLIWARFEPGAVTDAGPTHFGLDRPYARGPPVFTSLSLCPGSAA